MIMKKEEFVKWLLPVVAVVVIIESVVLITGLEKRSERVSAELVDRPVVLEEDVEPKVGLSFATEKREMEVGEKVMVEINATILESVVVDAIDLYIDFDPETIKISNLKFADGLPKPTFSKVSEQKKVIVANFLEVKPEGMIMSMGQVRPIMTMEVMALKTGNAQIKFATGVDSSDSVTMFIENKTSRTIPLSVSALNIDIK